MKEAQATQGLKSQVIHDFMLIWLIWDYPSILASSTRKCTGSLQWWMQTSGEEDVFEVSFSGSIPHSTMRLRPEIRDVMPWTNWNGFQLKFARITINDQAYLNVLQAHSLVVNRSTGMRSDYMTTCISCISWWLWFGLAAKTTNSWSCPAGYLTHTSAMTISLKKSVQKLWFMKQNRNTHEHFFAAYSG